MNKNLRNLRDRIPGAPNFEYNEFVKSETAIRKGIPNIPLHETIWVDIEKLAKNILQPIRSQFGGIKITSGYRSIPLCLAIGSTRTSNHTLGQAADIEPINSKIKLFDILEWIHNNLEYRELIAEYFPGGWIHVAYREGANDRILKLKDATHHYSHVSLEDIRKIYG